LSLMTTLERSPPIGVHRSLTGRALVRMLATSLVMFAVLSMFVAFRSRPPGIATEFDLRIRAYPGEWRFDLASALRLAGSMPAVVAVSFIGALVLWRRWHRRDLAVLWIAAPLLAGLADVAVKSAIERNVSTNAALQGAYGYGFPSGHAAISAALAAAVVVAVLEMSVRPRVRLLWIGGAVLFALAVALSSVADGAHRSLDVVGGLLLGVAATMGVAFAVASPFLSKVGRASDERYPRRGIS
jgi:membrane-associated phospholipid phosphatase